MQHAAAQCSANGLPTPPPPVVPAPQEDASSENDFTEVAKKNLQKLGEAKKRVQQGYGGIKKANAGLKNKPGKQDSGIAVTTEVSTISKQCEDEVINLVGTKPLPLRM